MQKKIILILIISCLFNNLFYFLSETFSFPIQFYLLGFRFNIFLFLNIVIMVFYFNKIEKDVFWSYFRFQNFSLYFNYFFLMILIYGIICGILFSFGLVSIQKNKYFYEFGISSLFDFPIYFIWNLPFLLSIEIVWRLFPQSKSVLINVFTSFLFVLNFFLPIFIMKNDGFSLQNFSLIIFPFSLALYNSFILDYKKNLWLNSLNLFFSVWLLIILFGSKDNFLINTFFGRNYEEWEGFFKIKNQINFSVSSLIGFLFLIFCIKFYFNKRKIKENVKINKN